MTVRKKLTEVQTAFAFIIGGGLTLILLGFTLAAAQAGSPNAERFNVMMIVGGTLVAFGAILWFVVTRPWADFDDWATPLYTGHTDHGHSATTTDHADDLTKIAGISDRVQKVLNAVGITTFAQLAAHSSVELERIVRDSGLRASKTKAWIEQAKALQNAPVVASDSASHSHSASH